MREEHDDFRDALGRDIADAFARRVPSLIDVDGQLQRVVWRERRHTVQRRGITTLSCVIVLAIVVGVVLREQPARRTQIVIAGSSVSKPTLPVRRGGPTEQQLIDAYHESVRCMQRRGIGINAEESYLDIFEYSVETSLAIGSVGPRPTSSPTFNLDATSTAARVSERRSLDTSERSRATSVTGDRSPVSRPAQPATATSSPPDGADVSISICRIALANLSKQWQDGSSLSTEEVNRRTEELYARCLKDHGLRKPERAELISPEGLRCRARAAQTAAVFIRRVH